VIIAGTVLKYERIVGSKPATATAEARSWDFEQATIWDGQDAHTCMIGRDFGQPPGQGQDVVVEVAVSPRRNTRSGAWENSVTLVRRMSEDDLLALLPAATAARAA